MFKRIVVGTDGSDSASAAVGVAAEMASVHGAALHVVHAYKMPNLTAGAEVGVPVTDLAAGADLAKHAASMVETIARRLRDDGLAEVEPHVLAGSPAEAIVGVAETVDADLIVVGNRGMAGARRFLGSVPNSISHHAPCHVMIVRTCD